MGSFYASLQHGGASTSGLTLFVWSAVGMLALFNLFWMIYALRYWRTRPLPPHQARTPTIPQGAGDHFAKQFSPHVKTDDGVRGEP
jgi:hypothetical protein